ncbi:hypothetical protein SCP_1002940 [Sparassis crispa]|uniref:Pheromone B alpha 3 receptor n=1 Tax=Sparassis crispa TaxID=139825 RepID=A0A401GXW3_9APHY|nr:hypothetical protein SCP_1002940 [Sparassis crispa]GBE87047.1 hypothetical protein SCP_1002940 [Sparassis crispa]
MNSILWRDTVVNFAPVWCDISSRIIVASAVAIPAASLCINRRLYCIATIKSVSLSWAEKRRAVIIDLTIGLGIPLLQLICQYVVSGHRFDIFEGIGCYPYTYNTIAAYPLSVLWPLVIGLISAVYCVLTLREFFRRRAEFAEYLSANPSLTTNRYFRLMALASVELLCTVPISSYGLYLNLSAAPLSPWISWSNVHYDYSQVDQYPAVVWRTSRNSLVAFGLSTWAVPFCAFVFFGFFGFADEARKNYRKTFLFISRLCDVGSHKRLADRPSAKFGGSVRVGCNLASTPFPRCPPPVLHLSLTPSIDSAEKTDLAMEASVAQVEPSDSRPPSD